MDDGGRINLSPSQQGSCGVLRVLWFLKTEVPAVVVEGKDSRCERERFGSFVYSYACTHAAKLYNCWGSIEQEASGLLAQAQFTTQTGPHPSPPLPYLCREV